MAMDLDQRLRSAAFAYLNALTARSGGLVTRVDLEGMPFEGYQIRLIAAQQGIWRPRFLHAALSILTTYVRPGEVPPYEDQEMGADNYPRYKWRGTDPTHPDDVGLRRAMERGRPLIWFIGVRPGLYRARYPVWLAGEEPAEHQFVVALDDRCAMPGDLACSRRRTTIQSVGTPRCW
jgi:putative restriction endonuclease